MWKELEKRKMNCPICRGEILILFINYSQDMITDSKTEEMTKEIDYYNYLYSKSHDSVFFHLIQLSSFLYYIPFQLKNFVFQKKISLFALGKAIAKAFYVGFLILYILSPIDLIPEIIFGTIGFIDDFFVVILLVIMLSNTYYDYLVNTNHQERDELIATNEES